MSLTTPITIAGLTLSPLVAGAIVLGLIVIACSVTGYVRRRSRIQLESRYSSMHSAWTDMIRATSNVDQALRNDRNGLVNGRTVFTGASKDALDTARKDWAYWSAQRVAAENNLKEVEALRKRFAERRWWQLSHKPLKSAIHRLSDFSLTIDSNCLAGGPLQELAGLAPADSETASRLKEELQPNGASYTGTVEKFATGNPFAVTDVVVGADGAMYVSTGGRGTQSGLYRITYEGTESTAPAPAAAQPDNFAAARKIRRELERLALPGVNGAAAIATAWPYLDNDDRFLRYAARIALEKQPVETWRNRLDDKASAQTKLTAALALARTTGSEQQRDIASLLVGLPFHELSREQKLELMRVYGVLFARGGTPSGDVRARVIHQIDSTFPSGNPELDREAARLLIYLNAPGAIERSLDAMEQADTQEQAIHYAFCLCTIRNGWTLEERARYLKWFNNAMSFRGGHSFNGFIRNMREDAIRVTSETHAAALKDLIDQQPSQDLAVQSPPRPLVKQYALDELLGAIEKSDRKPDMDRGRKVFAEATCYKCHRFAGEGGITGPDLTAVAKRFSAREMLESLVHPSKVVSDQYQASEFVLHDGQIVRGKVINLFGDNVSVLTDMFNPDAVVNVQVSNIEIQRPSTVSLMPEGLLNTFQVDEIADLLAYLKSGGESAKLSSNN